MTSAADVDAKGSTGLAAVLTAAMTWSMLPLFLLGALGPALVDEFGIGAPLLGVLVSAGFGMAAVLSLFAGPVVAAVGPRRCLLVLFTVSAVVLAGFAAAPVYAVLVLAVAISGVPQALANPSTNQLISTRVPGPAKGAVTGWKQSGVQLGAFLAGLPLAAVAAFTDWRVAVGVAAVAALAVAAATLTLRPDPGPVRRVRRKAIRPSTQAWWLCGFSVLLGSGISTVNTYVTLFGTHQLGFSPAVAGGLVAVLGLAGIGGRVGWARVAGRSAAPGSLLAPLAAGAAVASLALVAAAGWWAGWAWVATIGLGIFAVSANAVSMVTVIATSPPDAVARDSSVVSAGFFAGFAIGPPLAGALAAGSGGRYQLAWLAVAVAFAAAAVVAWWWRVRTARS
ncbi:MFS transporter [Amycolatopsis azurea]|uniref:MFS transporter n=1 Tax=Amycolatopsis azurea TaxID=36819 RepID=UPI0038146837